jgi:radical SAM protein with 4Fe4S-binding SPASM domain
MAQFRWLCSPSSDAPAIRRRLLAMVERQWAERPASDELRTIYLFLTRRCNLGCQHCYIKGVGPLARDTDFDFPTIKKLIDQALPHGLKKVKVSGGEPLVHKDALTVLEYLGGLGLKEIVLETNGTLFREDTIPRLAAIRNLTVFISLDHIDELRHDTFREKAGAFAKTTRVLQALGQSTVQSVVTTTAYRDNYDKIPAIVDLVLGWGIKRHRTLLNIHPLGNARSRLDNAVTLDECDILIENLLASEHFRLGRAYVTLPPALMPLSDLQGVYTCGWGDSVLGILSTGDISMCSASYDDPKMIAGNALDRPLIEIWRHSPFFKELRSIREGHVKGVCGNCIFYRLCGGVCKMSSYAHYGEKDAPYPLCQEAYNAGAFPAYALVDPERDCTYQPGAIAQSRPPCDDGPSRLLQIMPSDRLTPDLRPSITSAPTQENGDAVCVQ